MSIKTRCPKCESSYRVKETLRGKRFVCKVCKSPVMVRDEPALVRDDVEGEIRPDLGRLFEDEEVREERQAGDETSTDLEMYADTSEELVLKRSSFDEEDAHHPRVKTSLLQRVFVRLSRSPWSIPAIAFFAAWVPLSVLEPNFAWVMNIILMSLCAAGAATVKVLEIMEIKFPNPLDGLNELTFGAWADSAQAAATSQSGVLKRKTKAAASGYQFAPQLLIMLAVLLVHLIVLTVVTRSL